MKPFLTEVRGDDLYAGAKVYAISWADADDRVEYLIEKGVLPPDTYVVGEFVEVVDETPRD